MLCMAFKIDPVNFSERLFFSRPEGRLILPGAKLNSRYLAGLKGELQDVIRNYMDVFCKSCREGV